jgi:hypothetical protein
MQHKVLGVSTPAKAWVCLTFFATHPTQLRKTKEGKKPPDIAAGETQSIEARKSGNGLKG